MPDILDVDLALRPTVAADEVDTRVTSDSEYPSVQASLAAVKGSGLIPHLYHDLLGHFLGLRAIAVGANALH